MIFRIFSLFCESLCKIGFLFGAFAEHKINYLNYLLYMKLFLLSLFSFVYFVDAFSVELHNRVEDTDSLFFDPYMREPVPKDAPEWMRDIADNPSGVNYNQMQRLFKEWTAVDVDARVKTVDKKQTVNFFRRWASAYRRFVSSDGTIVLPTSSEYAAKIDSMNRVTQQRLESRTANIWRNIGPNRTFNNNNSKVERKDHQVCVFRIAVSLSDSATLYCGTESGVVFKTTNQGESWQACAPTHNFGGSIYSIAVHPADKNIVYVGGGPWLWKSVDGGESWERCVDIVNRVNSIRIDPIDHNRVTIAAGGTNDDNSGGGFYISTNGGKTFYCTLYGTCFDHELQPGNSNRIYLVRRDIGAWAGIYISEDAGLSWSMAELPIYSTICGRLAVSEAPGGENYVYALVTCDSWGYDRGPLGGSGTPYILCSKDAGKSWENQTDKGGKVWDVTFSPIMDSAGGQGYFDMMIGASAEDPTNVLFGLTSLYRSTNEGVCNYRDHGIGGYQRNDWMHCDIQDIAIHPCGDTWICNDGGIKYSRDFFETKGQDRYDGIYASDYQGLGVGWNEDVMAAGRWHNGDVVHAASYGEGNSLHVGGVEIATGYVMKSNPWKVYFTDAMTRIMPREMDGTIESDVWTWFSEKKPYEALRINGEIATDPRYALKVFIQDMTNRWEGYLSYDEGASFQCVFDSEGEEFYSYEFARTNPDRVYISGNWNLWRSDDGGLSFYTCERPFPENDGGTYFTRVVIDPNDENHLLIICNNKYGAVVESFDGGTSWTPYNLGSLSNMRVHQIILVGDEYNSTYVTSYDGAYVYFKDNTMDDFIDYSLGLNPGARISKVVPFYKNGVLRMATNQGLWEAPLYHQDFIAVAQPMALNLGSGNLTANPYKEVQFDSYSIVRQDEKTSWEWSFSPQPQSVSNHNVRNPKVIFGKPGTYDVTLTVTTPAGTSSRTMKGMIKIDGETDVNKVEVVGEVGLVKQVLENGEPMQVLATGLDGDAVISIHNAKGALLHSATVPAAENCVDVLLPISESGTYIYQIKNSTKKFFGKFIIK